MLTMQPPFCDMKPQLNFSKFSDTPQWEESSPSVQLQNLSHLIASKLRGVYLIPLIDLFCVFFPAS